MYTDTCCCCCSVATSCPNLCDPIDCSPSRSSVHRIFQARILEWVPFPSPGDLPDSGIEPASPTWQVDFLPLKAKASVLVGLIWRPQEFDYKQQVLGPGVLGRPRGMGWGGKREGRSGWGTHVNPWLIHVNVWQNPLKYCEIISL